MTKISDDQIESISWRQKDMSENFKFVFRRAENIVGKRENAG